MILAPLLAAKSSAAAALSGRVGFAVSKNFATMNFTGTSTATPRTVPACKVPWPSWSLMSSFPLPSMNCLPWMPPGPFHKWSLNAGCSTMRPESTIATVTGTLPLAGGSASAPILTRTFRSG